MSQLLLGHVLCNGRRTIADILAVLHLKDIKNFSKFHWALSNAQWNALKGSKILFIKIVMSLLAKDEEIVIPLDTTVERRKGPKIKGLGRQRDAFALQKVLKYLLSACNGL